MMPPESEAQPALDFLSLVETVAKHKKALLRLPLIAALIILGLSYLLPNTYVGVSRIVPPQGQSLSAQLLAQMGSGTSLAGALFSPSPATMYVGMLQGTTIADRIIDRFNLFDRYKSLLGSRRTRVETRDKLAQVTSISLTPEGLIVIAVRDPDPTMAARIANAYVDEFKTLRRAIEQARASDRLAFFEKQIADARASLTGAEIALKQMQERTGVMVVEGQGNATIEASALLRAQITAKEVQVESARLFSTEYNPEYKKLVEELAALRRELAKLEGTQGRQKGDLLLPASKLPEHALEYGRRVRDLKYNEVLVELLSKQYEIARLEVAQDFTSVDVVDVATPSDSHDRPNRPLVAIVGYVLVLLLTFATVFVYEGLARLRRDPARAERVQGLVELLRPSEATRRRIAPAIRLAQRLLS